MLNNKSKGIVFVLIILIIYSCSSSKYSDVSGPDFSITDNITYHKGKPFSGKGYEFHEIWGVIFVGVYKNGLKEGEWKSYLEGDRVMDIITYKSGVQSGLFIKYYEDGKPLLRGSFLNGLEEGKWEVFYENGQLRGNSTFVNGKRIGKREEFNRDGSPWFTKYYEDGVEVRCEGDCNSEKDN